MRAAFSTRFQLIFFISKKNRGDVLVFGVCHTRSRACVRRGCVGAMATADTHRSGGGVGERRTQTDVQVQWTRLEVAQRAACGASLFVVDGEVIDFGSFAHPGGHAILAKHKGHDVTDLFKGTRAGEGRRYAHSEGAVRMLGRLKVGTVIGDERGTHRDDLKREKQTGLCERVFSDDNAAEEDVPSSVGSDDDEHIEKHIGQANSPYNPHSVDITKPLLRQVSLLGKAGTYERWVFTPDTSLANGQSLKFFENPILEGLSQSPWYFVPVVWLPVACYALVSGWMKVLGNGLDHFWQSISANVTIAFISFTFGWHLWHLMEYSFHRFVFHSIPSGALGAKLHFAIHGCHHKAPMDKTRLTFPPTAAAPVIYFFRKVFFLVVPWVMAKSGRVITHTRDMNRYAHLVSSHVFVGCLLAYVTYDLTHYAFHVCDGDVLRKYFGNNFQILKSKHMKHHYDDHSISFGISNDLWDTKLGTVKRDKKTK